MKRSKRNKTRGFSILFPALTIISIASISILSSFYEKSWSFRWNDIRKPIKDSIEVALWSGYTKGIGPNGRHYTKAKNTRFWIMNNASTKELLQLTDYPNGTIKALAYEGLIKRPDYNEKENLLVKSINDNDYKVYFSAGCTGIEIEICEYLIQFELQIDPKSPRFVDPPFEKHDLSQAEINRVLDLFYQRKIKSGVF
ncbi:hypothetical protein [Seonamhaeicola marinus]|uniref:Uncharacterized protein n=1 Tax=Seonamhaeicola marinus TaxID=1912246 RepID=A0A5D0HKX5_9FLAO|nr:hypothetical protein [Seonamhaeicola marinus]TYA71971.1 hypothetical protein FUA24_20700 [Seonamhaeicola marinus]